MAEVVTTADGGTRDIATILPSTYYSNILWAGGSHTAAKVAGTYSLTTDDALVVNGAGSAFNLKTIYLAVVDFPSVNGVATKLRLRAQLYTNDVAPFTGTFVFGLYPITRPATSGGAGVCIYTMGTVVTNSTVTFTNPAADAILQGASSDFTFPSDGHYVIGVVTNQTMAASSHAHVAAQLQTRN